MITEAELRRLAARSGVDAMVQDLDYVLSWFLAGLWRQPTTAQHLIFKGGTCLRKCYLSDYRFSEDLDFTLLQRWDLAGVQATVEEVRHWSQERGGPDFGAEPARFETISDEYGQESLQGRVYFRGPLRWGGPARVIQIDISRGEKVVFPTESRRLMHPYSDSATLEVIDVTCYSLAEMLAEKVRAVAGQRRFAVSRDLYDIYQLSQQGTKVETVRAALPSKFAAKGLDVRSFSIERLLERRQSMAADWNRRLVHLFPSGQLMTFDTVWPAVIEFIQEVMAAPLDETVD